MNSDESEAEIEGLPRPTAGRVFTEDYAFGHRFGPRWTLGGLLGPWHPWATNAYKVGPQIDRSGIQNLSFSWGSTFLSITIGHNWGKHMSLLHTWIWVNLF